ncbi:MAG: dihydroorotate dehydrogenase-like protein, partial [Bacteroidales bacterium]|nr:dihydroorotate dehydrogenase-like protein [Bacteroidales bacterium]
TKYLGIELKNPVVVGASNIVTNIDNIKKAEEAGAAAIVYKSLFEEQIQLENAQLDDQLTEYAERNAEMTSLFPNIEHAGPEEFLFNLAKAKQSVNIPVIASLNAVLKESWVSFAKKIEEMGVDAIELNFYHVPKEIGVNGDKVIASQIEILKAIKSELKIPVSVKLSPAYANVLNVVDQMDKAGADGFVLFNRMFQPEIDVEIEEHYTPFLLSTPDDNRLPLRFAGLLYEQIKGSICSSTGIYSGTDIAKMVLAGADCVQVVSALYKNKIDSITTMLSDLEGWMDKKGYASLDDFRGKLSNAKTNDIFVYKRAQYIDMLLKSDEILKKYPVV